LDNRIIWIIIYIYLFADESMKKGMQAIIDDNSSIMKIIQKAILEPTFEVITL
jgi:hypothetical protein